MPGRWDNKALKWKLAVWILFLPAFAATQHPFAHRLGEEQGLPSSIIYDIAQDSLGVIWLATDRGVASYDGHSVEVYNTGKALAGNDVILIRFDSKGRLWCFSFNGTVSVRDSGRWENSNTNPALRIETDYEDFFVTGFAEDARGRILLVTSQGMMYRIDPDLMTLETLPFQMAKGSYSPYYALEIGKDNALQLATPVAWYRIEDGKDIHVVASEPFFKYRPNSLCKFFGTDTLFLADNDSLRIISSSPEKGRSIHLQGFLNDIRRSEKGRYFLSCRDRLTVLDQNLEPIADYFKGINISRSMHDMEGNLWVCTIGDGLFIVPNDEVMVRGRQDWNCIGFTESAEGEPMLMLEDRLLDLPGANTVLDASNEGWPLPFVDVKSGSNGMWWIGLENGVLEWRENSEHASWKYRLTAIKDMHTVGKDSLLVSTSKGVFLFDDAARKHLRNEARGRSSRFNHTNYIHENRIFRRAYAIGGDFSTGIYLGTQSGLFRRGKEKEEFELIPGTEGMSISEIETDGPDRVYFATLGNGLGMIEKGKLRFANSEAGMSSDICNAIELDAEGVWVATNQGINRLRADSTLETGYQIVHYGESNGLASPIIKDLKLNGDSLWVVTKQGIAEVTEAQLRRKTIRPGLFLKALKIDGEAQPVDRKLELAPRQRNLLIEYRGIHFRDPAALSYRYKIEAYDDDWKHTTNTQINFEELPFGEHQVIVQAGIDGGHWSTPLAVSFFLRKPLWMQTWFLVLAGLLIGGLGWGLLSLRVRAIRRRELLRRQVMQSEHKALRAQMNPHFIFNALNSIQELITSEKQEKAHFYLSRFGKLVRNILDNSEKTFVSLQEELDMLQLYLELEQMRLDGKFDFEIIVGKNVKTIDIHFPTMISQVHAENAVWHGIRHLEKKGKIIVMGDLVDGRFVLSIEDNGVGREEATRRKNRKRNPNRSRGQKLVADRLEAINQAFGADIEQKIIDLKNEKGEPSGTRIEISLPYD